MTVLAACQSAAVRLIGKRPATIFSSTDKFEVELADLATDVAKEIAKKHDWQKLQVLNTFTGTGVATAFDMPGDYDRMLKKGKVHSSRFQTATFRRVTDEDEWIYITSNAIAGVPGSWILLGGQMNIFPAMPLSETARFYYISKFIAAGKHAFTDDADIFRLPERLLTLGLIWRWRAQKRLEYAEDLENFEIALSEEIATDKGSRVITVGRQRTPAGADRFAFPGTIVQS